MNPKLLPSKLGMSGTRGCREHYACQQSTPITGSCGNSPVISGKGNRRVFFSFEELGDKSQCRLGIQKTLGNTGGSKAPLSKAPERLTRAILFRNIPADTRPRIQVSRAFLQGRADRRLRRSHFFVPISCDKALRWGLVFLPRVVFGPSTPGLLSAEGGTSK